MPQEPGSHSRYSRPVRALWVTLGVISLVLGIIGIFLPLLPTTPFVLLAAACFARGSARFHTWLVSHPRFGPTILDWQKHRAIPWRAKVFALSTMWVSMGTTAWFLRARPYASLTLIGIALAVSIWMLRLPTRAPASRSSSQS
ncbi:YbaN family protein [Cupriavidus pampae]|uniref:Inner membrane protein YbaN n=1 Tax=Cupriavidus pampae TaxID=659251 RepID=A0ABN7YAE9_9BURK|nr:YbaN family protein [Cupriavidus pampae]CAG9170364.1 Inner membrane protein YbaN [Cupriavidus pampae]